jgi:hypothetical protein
MNTNPPYYDMRFVDGLRDDIKAMMMIQRPATVDAAWVLALVQEEAMESGKKREYTRVEPSFNMMVQRSALSLTVPPKLDKLAVASLADDKSSTKVGWASTHNDKLNALKQYWRAGGLCDRCAEKWSYGHNCSSTVQLHVIQELFSNDGCNAKTHGGDFATKTSQLCICVPEAAILGVESTMSMKSMVSIQNQSLLILLDTGSSHSLLSSKLAVNLIGLTPLQKPLTVQVANGAQIHCNS